MCDDAVSYSAIHNWISDNGLLFGAALCAAAPIPWLHLATNARRRKTLDATAMCMLYLFAVTRPPISIRIIFAGLYSTFVSVLVVKRPWEVILAPLVAVSASLLVPNPCKALWIAIVDGVCATTTLARWTFFQNAQTRYHKAVSLLCYAEFCIIIGFFLFEEGIRDKETHLTWWGLLGLAVWDAAHGTDAVLSSKPHRHTAAREFVSPALGSIQASVAIGTIGLSSFKCNLLENAYEENGPAVFYVGNFAMHYWPIIRRLTSAPKSNIFSVQWGERVLVGALIVAIYASSVDVSTTYGCTDSINAGSGAALTALLGIVGSIVAIACTALYTKMLHTFT